MTQATRLIDDRRAEAMKYFQEGEEALTTALKLTDAGRAYEHPFVKFFASAEYLFRKLEPRDTEFDAVLQLFRVWIQRAKDSPAYATSFGKKRLRDLQAMELKQALRARRVS